MGHNLIGQAAGLVGPGGDPGQLRQAARACRTLAADLASVTACLDRVAREVGGCWSGPAHAAFAGAWARFRSGLHDYSADLRQAAGILERVAGSIQQAQAAALDSLAAREAGGAAAVTGGLCAPVGGIPEAEAAAVKAAMARAGAPLATEAQALAAVTARMALRVVAPFGAEAPAKSPARQVTLLDAASLLAGVLGTAQPAAGSGWWPSWLPGGGVAADAEKAVEHGISNIGRAYARAGDEWLQEWWSGWSGKILYSSQGGVTFVTTPRGVTYKIPGDWVSREADNGRGIVFQRPGAFKDQDSIRIMEPTEDNPNGYVRIYNRVGGGQAVDVNGKPTSPDATHIPEDELGDFPELPLP